MRGFPVQGNLQLLNMSKALSKQNINYFSYISNKQSLPGLSIEAQKEASTMLSLDGHHYLSPDSIRFWSLDEFTFRYINRPRVC